MDRVLIVLVRARNPNNIGAAARAMHDFGFGRLRLVNEYAVPFQTARSAVDASEVLADAEEFPSVGAAVADCTLVIGTTAVGERAIEHSLLALPEAAGRVREELAEDAGRVALLFGSEKTGLSNEELSHCHGLLTIPMQQYTGVRHPSMNLGQAVAVCLYELTRGGYPLPETAGWRGGDGRSLLVPSGELPVTSGQRRVPLGQMERMTALLIEVLQAAEYDRHHPAGSDDEQMRRMVLRMGITAVDLPVWMGILRQIAWKLRGGVRGRE